MNSMEFELLAKEKGVPAAYGEAVGREQWGSKMAELVNDHMHAGFARWVLFGTYSGDFMNAFVKGDLFKALEKADHWNLNGLHNTAIWFWNYAPSGCFGSEAKAKAWHERGGLLGKEAS